MRAPLRGSGESGTATVIPLVGVGRELGYRIPDSLRGQVRIGSLVRVPILRRRELGVVRSLEVSGDFPVEKLRYIVEVLQAFPALSEDLIRLADWMQAYYGSSAEAAIEVMLPAAVRGGRSGRRRTTLALGRKLDPDELEKLRRRAPKQAVLYEMMAKQIGAVPKGQLLKRLQVGYASCRALTKLGILTESEERIEREAYEDELGLLEQTVASAVELTEDQAAATDNLLTSLATGEFHVHLLHGVTGSGKTEVYIEVIRRVLQEGGGAIYLVPEVALTPQTVGRLRSRLEDLSGHKTMVWHSHLTAGERLHAWEALASGEARVVVGARSAVFAPVRNVRAIIVDEEHEPAYKQGDSPRYHGRDVAVYRAKLCDALCVLGSATPSLESLRNVRRGKYKLDLLPRRVDGQELPMIRVVDMKREIILHKGLVSISRLLAEKMRERFDRREQIILFINRRGYSSSVLCLSCGHVAQCAHCSVTLTYHRVDETIRCHMCGYQQEAPRRCHKCGGAEIRWRGQGTQRVVEATRKILPQARVMRMDSDAMRKRDLFRRVLADFRIGRIDILVGTQMIAKGLDFPNVTLVGLIDADLSLKVPDFRSAERCFQLIVQVAGRAGRGDRSGEVVVQSFLPYGAPIQYARQGDFDGFSDEELSHRREYRYPPYRHLIQHLFRGKNPHKVQFFAEQWVRRVEAVLGNLVEIRGPAPSPREKVKDNYRFQVWYFVANVSKTVASLIELRREFKMDKDVLDVLDVDPVQLT